jgi:hypothetical protein
VLLGMRAMRVRLGGVAIIVGGGIVSAFLVGTA